MYMHFVQKRTVRAPQILDPPSAAALKQASVTP
jgi:hypothetical protein